MSKYLNRTSTAYRFKWDVLMKWDKAPLTQEEKEIMWRAFLLILERSDTISDHQAKTWKYPNKLIKNA